MRADAMLEKGNLDGQRVWLRILAAVKELLDTRSGDGAVVHRVDQAGQLNGESLVRRIQIVTDAAMLMAMVTNAISPSATRVASMLNQSLTAPNKMGDTALAMVTRV